MRTILASIFRLIFSVKFIKKTFYGFYKRIFFPLNVFKGVKKNIIYKNSLKLELDIEDWIPQNIYFLNEYEEKEIIFLEKSLESGDCFIDIGANIGLFSLVASKCVGEKGSVFSFEPFHRNYDKSVKHIEINNLNNITLEKTAISDQKGKMELFLDEKEKNSGMVTAFSDNYTLQEEVDKTTIDEYISTKNISEIKLIKIDIEGGEYHALLGMRNTLVKYKPTLIIEINPDATISNPTSEERTNHYLAELGYRKYYLDNEGNIINIKMKTDNSNNFIFSTDLTQN